MERHDVSTGIRRSWELLERIGIAESFASSEPLDVNSDFRDLVLSRDTTHLDIYQFGVRKSYYNILLFDHSFLQFGWTASSVVRYAFYPNPFVSSPDAVHAFRKYRTMVREGNLSEEEFGRLVADMSSDGGVPIFRYESSPAQRVELKHPCSHFHIGVHSENRWAVSRLLTPLAFTMLIAKHYYIDEWSQEEVGATSGVNPLESALMAERQNCAQLEDDLFSDNERSSFHFC